MNWNKNAKPLTPGQSLFFTGVIFVGMQVTQPLWIEGVSLKGMAAVAVIAGIAGLLTHLLWKIRS